MSMALMRPLIQLVFLISLSNLLTGCVSDCHLSVTTIQPVDPMINTKIELGPVVKCKVWK